MCEIAVVKLVATFVDLFGVLFNVPGLCVVFCGFVQSVGALFDPF